MKSRCFNPKCKSYSDYGGRGITVCERWLKYENFIADMGMRPAPNFSIERKDTNGNYCPENCFWADDFTQTRNKRNNIWLTIDGVTKILNDWMTVAKASETAIRRRLMLGWSHKEAVFTLPYNFRRSSRGNNINESLKKIKLKDVIKSQKSRPVED